MKRLVLSLAVCLVVVLSFQGLVFASAGDNGIEKEVDGIGVELLFMKGVFETGNNEIMVKLHNEEKDEPLADAKVKITADMERESGGHGMDMNEFKPITVDLVSGSEKGEYTGTIELKDAGKWIFTVNILTGNEEKNVDLEVEITGGGPNWAVIGGFLALIALIVVIAAIKKKKKTATV